MFKFSFTENDCLGCKFSFGCKYVLKHSEPEQILWQHVEYINHVEHERQGHLRQRIREPRGLIGYTVSEVREHVGVKAWETGEHIRHEST